jgi:hypothetical protein
MKYKFITTRLELALVEDVEKIAIDNMRSRTAQVAVILREYVDNIYPRSLHQQQEKKDQTMNIECPNCYLVIDVSDDLPDNACDESEVDCKCGATLEIGWYAIAEVRGFTLWQAEGGTPNEEK